MALRTVWPDFTRKADVATMVVGIFGTTISPYLFFWQASEEVEDQSRQETKPLAQDAPGRPGTAPRPLG